VVTFIGHVIGERRVVPTVPEPIAGAARGQRGSGRDPNAAVRAAAKDAEGIDSEPSAVRSTRNGHRLMTASPPSHEPDDGILLAA
jgi:hypothetical protein